ncbi:MAG: class I SAM-dependent methyltransferase [Acidobacteriota bacterium]|nr:class I SAM-dependent methyltransferase [Acidobacteriota bacterium]
MIIFAWYRRQKEDFGIVAATWLLWRVLWRRAYVVASNKLLPTRLQCPCCGWEGRRFFDYIEMGYTVRNCACPVCDSHPRHRALFLWLIEECRISEKAGIALVFAPEKAFAPLWQTATNLRAYKIDIEPSRGVDVLADLMRLPFTSEIADLMWCHHVLEQVGDDRIALTELHRVLRSSSGELIVSVGSAKQETTLEFGFANKALSGNRRTFGADFPERLAEAGFKVRQVVYNMTESERRKYGVYAEPFYRCTKN